MTAPPMIAAPPQVLEPDEWIYEPREHALANSPAPPATAPAADGLHELEQRVARGLGQALAGLLDAGRALAVVRAQRLYEPAYPSWTAYTRARWNLSDSRADQLIDSARTAAIVLPAGAQPPAIPEAVIREFRPVRQQRGERATRDAWQQIIAGHDDPRPLTARAVRDRLAALGLPVCGTGITEPRRAARLDQIASALAGARARVERLRAEARTRTLDAGKLERLAAEAHELGQLIEALVAEQPAAPERRCRRGHDMRLRPSGEWVCPTCEDARRHRYRTRLAAEAAHTATGEPLPDDEPCPAPGGHGSVRDQAGVCVSCRRPDLDGHARAMPAAA